MEILVARTHMTRIFKRMIVWINTSIEDMIHKNAVFQHMVYTRKHSIYE